MAIKGSDNVTVTLARSTVKHLRLMKGSETWDELIWRLASRERCGITCLLCGAWFGTNDVTMSLRDIAKREGWHEVVLNHRTSNVGFICPTCVRD